jgi:hypothetical protein
MSLPAIEGAIQQVVLNRFYSYAAAVWARGRFDSLDAEQVLIQTDMPCAELHDNG